MDYLKLGQRIREERVKQYLTQEKLSEKLEMSAVFIGQIERGDRKLSLETLVKISNFFQVSIDALLSDSIKVSDNTDINELVSIVRSRSKEELTLITDTVKTVLRHLKENKVI